MRRLQERKLDAAWRAAVKARDGHTCQMRREGCTEDGTDAHHIVTRERRATRWDMANGITLCRSCHNWIHAHPADGLIWLTGKIGEPALASLVPKSWAVANYTREDRERMLAELEGHD